MDCASRGKRALCAGTAGKWCLCVSSTAPLTSAGRAVLRLSWPSWYVELSPAPPTAPWTQDSDQVAGRPGQEKPTCPRDPHNGCADCVYLSLDLIHSECTDPLLMQHLRADWGMGDTDRHPSIWEGPTPPAPRLGHTAGEQATPAGGRASHLTSAPP